MAPPATAADKLDKFGIDAVCEAIVDRTSLTAIAAKVGVSIGSLVTWLDADPERSARAREARRATARAWDEAAEERLDQAADDFDLRKAKELAQHYRWRASKISPAEYGDKTLHADAEGNNLPPPVFLLQPVAPKE